MLVQECDFFIQFIASIQRYAYIRFLIKKKFLQERNRNSSAVSVLSQLFRTAETLMTV